MVGVNLIDRVRIEGKFSNAKNGYKLGLQLGFRNLLTYVCIRK